MDGRTVSSAGDLNGDGIDDIVIGMPRAFNQSGSFEGAAYVVFGRAGAASFGATVDLDALNGVDGFRLKGVSPTGYLDSSVAGAGDVNGDRLGDLIIGLGTSPTVAACMSSSARGTASWPSSISRASTARTASHCSAGRHQLSARRSPVSGISTATGSMISSYRRGNACLARRNRPSPSSALAGSPCGIGKSFSAATSPPISPIQGCGRGDAGKSCRSAGPPVRRCGWAVAHLAGALRATRFAPGESVDVLSSTPARPNCREPRLYGHLNALASHIAEIGGLVS